MQENKGNKVTGRNKHLFIMCSLKAYFQSTWGKIFVLKKYNLLLHKILPSDKRFSSNPSPDSCQTATENITKRKVESSLFPFLGSRSSTDSECLWDHRVLLGKPCFLLWFALSFWYFRSHFIFLYYSNCLIKGRMSEVKGGPGQANDEKTMEEESWNI